MKIKAHVDEIKTTKDGGGIQHTMVIQGNSISALILTSYTAFPFKVGEHVEVFICHPVSNLQEELSTFAFLKTMLDAIDEPLRTLVIDYLQSKGK